MPAPTILHNSKPLLYHILELSFGSRAEINNGFHEVHLLARCLVVLLKNPSKVHCIMDWMTIGNHLQTSRILVGHLSWHIWVQFLSTSCHPQCLGKHVSTIDKERRREETTLAKANCRMKEVRWCAVDEDCKRWSMNTCHNPINLFAMKAKMF